MKFKKICGCGYETIVDKEVWTVCPECGERVDWEFIPYLLKETIVTLKGEKRYEGRAKDGRKKVMMEDDGVYVIYLLESNKCVGMKVGEMKNRIKAESIMMKL